MNSATLIAAPDKKKHTPPPLTGDDKAVLDKFYTKYEVINEGPEQKNNVLKKVIQARSFFALGGDETPEMELRANERIFLLKYRSK